MKVLYTTDLHGNREKYEKIIKKVKESDYDILILGADILPKSGNIFKTQVLFIHIDLLEIFESIDIPILLDFGNDDLSINLYEFKKVVDKYDHVHYTHQKKIDIGGYSFIGMHFVPDYPFGLKDWCRRDSRIMDPYQLTSPVISSKKGYSNILDLEEYFLNLPSISEELNNLPKPTKGNKVIYLFHSPPRTIGLDLCNNKQGVGSDHVTQFLIVEQPLISLHGHIHESPDVSGKYYNNLMGEETICIQPGQTIHNNKVTYCEFDLTNIKGTIQREII